tara:strand:- start:47 stop:274 length:228 start_codon:yes stop_codon:yes gene_type:complete
LKPKRRREAVRYLNVKMKNGNVTYKDNLMVNEETAFTSLDLVVNNSNYQPEYLKKLYAVDFYRILKKLEQKLKNK